MKRILDDVRSANIKADQIQSIRFEPKIICLRDKLTELFPVKTAAGCAGDHDGDRDLEGGVGLGDETNNRALILYSKWRTDSSTEK